ncbi:alpha/beta hydrolase [Edaphobacter acidisoli]|uniref:Alpha/beta hydrolase n=1 Tax=Edaphobacter acidisoli TaxID=2040573 RepID=A0A916RUP6_9BACT|nr:alpha/beta hydrolase [Edaphobacter acidisoli]GGA71965.1 alpha/beta hydrolase [Edaphobacter acidisoli]
MALGADSMKQASINGVSLAWREAGNGLPVVFVHGHPFDHTMWDPQVTALSSKYRVIAPDLRGYGVSEVPESDTVTLETMAKDIRALLDYLHIDRAVVAGLSMGGQVAMAFADLYPERLAGLVLAATFAEGETPEGVAVRRAMAERFINEGSVLPGGEMLPRLLAPASLKRDPELAIKVFTMIAHAPSAGSAAALRGRALRKDYVEPLTHVTVPTLIAVGTEDKYVTRERAERMRAAIRGSRLEVFEGVGHMPNLEAAERFNSVLLEFLAGIKP